MLDLVDTHCHLDWAPLAGQVEAVVARAREAGVRQMVTIGTSVATSRVNVQLAQEHPALYAAVGVHPNEADGVTDQTMHEIRALAGSPRVVAIGEVGLDAYRQHASRENQERTLRDCIALAREKQLPLLIHCRDAYEALLHLLRETADGPCRGIIHCASGPPAFIEQALALGFHVSFAGNVTFPSASALRALVPLVPDERLLLETDAPFLAPQPVRGQSNEPAFLAHTAAAVAALRGITPEALAALTSRNARVLFALPPPDA